jgi:hypothetical protein
MYKVVGIYGQEKASFFMKNELYNFDHHLENVVCDKFIDG